MTIFLLSVAPAVLGQLVTWEVTGAQQPVEELNLPEQLDSTFNESMRSILQELHYRGHLEAAYGMGSKTDSTVTGTIYIGPMYRWASLKPGNVPEVILSRSGYREKDFADRPLELSAMQRLFVDIIDYSENHGFPFAQVWLDSVSIENETARGVLTYEPGAGIVFDSLELEGYTEIRREWLMSYLEVSPGTEFSQQVLDQVPQRIRRLPFARMSGNPTLTFQNESAKLYLPLERVESNRIDGIVGFLPNEESDGGIRITGQLDLSLVNLFNSGKQLDVVWQRVKPESQTLGIRYRHPNILRSPIHFDGGFELLKEDSTFINRHFRLALAFTSGRHELGVFTRFKSTRLLSTSQYNDASDLPEFSDQNVNYYGLEYSSSELQDGWSDNKGWRIYAQGAIGDKRIRRNGDIPESLYDGVDLETLQVTGQLDAAWGTQLGKRSLFYSRVQAGFIEDDQLFQNDLFRIGGLRTMRGFTENNFYVSSYAVATLEYQLFFEAFSYLFLFADQGLLENASAGTGLDYPTGFGFGLNLRTGGGDLQLVYALGRTADQPVNFSLSKFHFGYIAKF